jgi:hypothetical protein
MGWGILRIYLYIFALFGMYIAWVLSEKDFLKIPLRLA